MIANVEFLTVADHEAMKIYEASLRYFVAMAFHNCYPNLKIRFAYNVSAASRSTYWIRRPLPPPRC
jgi:hypothetical protein